MAEVIIIRRNAVMRLSIPLSIAAALVAVSLSGAASAAGRTLDDSTYIAVARCAGLAEGVGADAAPFNSVLDAQSGSRLAEVMDRADEAKDTAKRNAGHSGPDGKAGYAKEVDGACRSYLQQG
jgi:hypothetical protein